MRRLAKNLILATAVVSVMFFVDPSPAGAESLNCENSVQCLAVKKNCPFYTDELEQIHLDFWGKFRDTVMPDPDAPQDNNPPKEMRKPKPVDKPKPAPPPREVKPKPAD